VVPLVVAIPLELASFAPRRAFSRGRVAGVAETRIWGRDEARRPATPEIPGMARQPRRITWSSRGSRRPDEASG